MSKTTMVLSQIVVAAVVVAIYGFFCCVGNDKSWQDIYDSCDKSVIEVYALTTGADSEQLSSGTGFVYRLNGRYVVVTNRHVASAASQLAMRFPDDVVATATVLDASELHDLAAVEPEGVNLKRYGSLPAGNSLDLKLGEELLTIGHPVGESHHISVGFYAGKSTDSRGRTLLRLSMAVDPGNSGGPLLNQQGEVVGVITQRVAESANIAFAIPIEKLLELSL